MDSHSHTKLMPITDITVELVNAWLASEKEKHRDCHGACRHLPELHKNSIHLAKVTADCEALRNKVDGWLKKTLRHLQTDPDNINVLRTLVIAVLSEGWNLAGFYLEGQQLDREYGVQ